MSALSSPEIRILQALEGGPSLDRYQLGSTAGVSAPELETAIDGLVRAGYVERIDRDGIDRFRVVGGALKRLLVPLGA